MQVERFCVRALLHFESGMVVFGFAVARLLTASQ